jgi:hypothetical protein
LTSFVSRHLTHTKTPQTADVSGEFFLYPVNRFPFQRNPKESKNMKFLISFLLIVHGLIVAGQSAGSFKPVTGPVGVENPAWISWWPTRLGQSWLLSGLGLENAFVITVSGALWLLSGIALVAAGLGVLGFIVPAVWWRSLAALGAALSLFMLLVHFHPLSIIGTASSLAVLVALLWVHWPPTSVLS